MSGNDVFNAANAPDSRVTETLEQAQQELGFDIPVETVPLPSLGRAYPASHPLHMQQSVDIRAMTAREEDILTSRAFIKNGSVITQLIQSCLIDKAVDARSLLSGDRNAILIAIRITGYGSDYNVNVTCPACGTGQVHTCMLSDLPIRQLDTPPVKEGANEFELVLPASGKKACIAFATGYDEEEAMITSERKKKQGIVADNLVTDRLFRALVSIQGNTDKSFINKFIRNMPARDSLEIRRFLEGKEPTVTMLTDFTCDSCQYEEEMPLPMGATFFWPGA
jgi:hypothetical protein